MRVDRIDSYYLKVRQLLMDHVRLREDLEKRLQQLRYDLIDIPSAVCLRPYPLDVQIIPGSPDPESKLWGNIDQIHKETRACQAEIRRVEGEMREIERLVARVMRLDGQPGEVLRALYIEQLTQEALAARLCCTKSNINHCRRRGMEKLANALYSRIYVS